jgi:septal ring factor EnvC (AmiA/AmiB activator)
MSNLLQSRIPQLQREMEIITTNDWDPMFCVAKLSAVAADDAEGYCEALEEELAVKGERLAELVRTNTLSTEIVERLRNRIRQDEEVIEQLRSQNEELVTEFKALKESRESIAGDLAAVCYDQRDMNRLVANLEAENLREARLGAKASADAAHWKERYERAAAAAAEAQDAAHRATVLLEAEKDESMRWRKLYEREVESNSLVRRATWAPLRVETEV